MKRAKMTVVYPGLAQAHYLNIQLEVFRLGKLGLASLQWPTRSTESWTMGEWKSLEVSSSSLIADTSHQRQPLT